MPLALMVKEVSQEKKEAEDLMVIKAILDPKDPREKWGTEASQAHLPTPLILLWQKVAEATQDSQGPMGSQDPGVSKATSAHKAPLARPSEMKMGGEASRVKWDPKVSWETRASLHGTPARQELMESQGTEDSQGPPDHLGQMVTFSALKEKKESRAFLGLLVSLGLVDRKDGKVMKGSVSAQLIS